VIVAIHGLGLMGASLGAALRARRAARRVIGVARRPAVARRALALGAADEAGVDLERLAEADVVVLATPVRTILSTLPEVARRLAPGATLTDLGSTKGAVMRAGARAVRGRDAGFIGGHPMAGNERSGVEACAPALYEGRPFLVVRGPATRRLDRRRLLALARGVGARPVELPSAAAHDRLVAAVSHVPYLAAYALAGATAPAHRALAGPAFGDATRVTRSPAEMVLDFLLTNGPAIGAAARLFARRFEALARAVRRGDERTLRRLLRTSTLNRP
jgi:prephenate dehydrogenase